ncbi:phenol hydroxylase P5 protein [mine drainage metagenome]|uniref:Phenol hydroxylase P5 protein n=1 Tax=mine drainage metagenome TaxID=410659 RepID=A0A1J5RHR2_9ZZZZ
MKPCDFALNVGVGKMPMEQLDVGSGRSKSGAVCLTVQDGEGVSTTVRAECGQTLLEAALGGGVPLPFGCRAGDCGVCKCEVLEGEVDEGWADPLALPSHERTQRRVLACTSILRGPVTVRVNNLDRVAPRLATMRVVAHERRTADVVVFRAAAEHERIVPFLPGQYVKLTLPTGAIRAFSIANEPGMPHLEFHVRRKPNGWASQYVYDRLRVGDDVGIAGPFGNAVLRNDCRPIIGVCGGTGYAPLRSILHHALAAQSERLFRLYWFVRGPKDVYDEASLRRLGAVHKSFSLTVLTSPEAGSADGGVAQLLAHCRAHGPITGPVYAAGPTRMVTAVRKTMLLAGLPEDEFHADPFGDQQ